MKVWQALYNDMYYESSAETLSLHLTKEGAEKAIEKHKQQNKLEHLEDYSPERLAQEYELKKEAGFTDKEIEEYDKRDLEDWPKSWQWWGVKEMEVEE
jgi:hypothetical protein